MNVKQIPLVAALALALGTLAPGCTQDTSSAASAASDATATAQADQAATSASDAAGAHDDDHHGHDTAHAAGVDFPVPDHHVQWEPDAPLIEGMSRVRVAIAGVEADPDPATVVARATDIDAAIEYMFANCKLETEPDVALHAVLARLMAGSQALHANPADSAPVADMHAAVGNYEALFDDPNG